MKKIDTDLLFKIKGLISYEMGVAPARCRKISIASSSARSAVILRESGGSRKKMEKESYVYILASKRNGTLYIGVTSDLIKRVWEHKNKIVGGFSAKYSVDKLVYYEQHIDIMEAIRREKALKKWLRKWKLALIEKSNPHWLALVSHNFE